jgi:hypothetical protein
MFLGLQESFEGNGFLENILVLVKARLADNHCRNQSAGCLVDFMDLVLGGAASGMSRRISPPAFSRLKLMLCCDRWQSGNNFKSTFVYKDLSVQSGNRLKRLSFSFRAFSDSVDLIRHLQLVLIFVSHQQE